MSAIPCSAPSCCSSGTRRLPGSRVALLVLPLSPSIHAYIMPVIFTRHLRVVHCMLRLKTPGGLRLASLHCPASLMWLARSTMDSF